ncbi:MAG: methyltransferase domain-containing protein [Chloroflexota bacterium]
MMAWSGKNYKWFYDHIHSRYYALLVKWCFRPFGGEDRVRKELIARIDFSSREKILDMCCGIGGVTFVMAGKAGKDSEIVGMDLSSGQIAIARKNNRFGNVRFIEGDVTGTGLEDGYFDKVFITHALHEMPGEVRQRVLSEARRVLKKNGEVIILELDDPGNILIRLFIGLWFFYWLPFNFETSTRRDMLRHGLVTELETAGFRNVTKQSKYRGVFQVVRGIHGG